MFGKPKSNSSFCPLIKGECIKDACKFWVHVQGQDPQTGNAVDFPDCAIRFLPTLLVQVAKESSFVAASVDSARNENKKSMAGLAGVLLETGKLSLPRKL